MDSHRGVTFQPDAVLALTQDAKRDAADCPIRVAAGRFPCGNIDCERLSHTERTAHGSGLHLGNLTCLSVRRDCPGKVGHLVYVQLHLGGTWFFGRTNYRALIRLILDHLSKADLHMHVYAGLLRTAPHSGSLEAMIKSALSQMCRNMRDIINKVRISVINRSGLHQHKREHYKKSCASLRSIGLSIVQHSLTALHLLSLHDSFWSRARFIVIASRRTRNEITRMGGL